MNGRITDKPPTRQRHRKAGNETGKHQAITVPLWKQRNYPLFPSRIKLACDIHVLRDRVLDRARVAGRTDEKSSQNNVSEPPLLFCTLNVFDDFEFGPYFSPKRLKTS